MKNGSGNGKGAGADADKDLKDQFERIVSAVGKYADVVESSAQVFLDEARIYLENYPLPTVFSLVCLVFSIVPVFFFIGFCLFSTAFFLLAALIPAVFLSLTTIIIAFVVLVNVVGLIAFVSGLLCVSGTFTYLAIRLAYLVRQQGQYGLGVWTAEAQHVVLSTAAPFVCVVNRLLDNGPIQTRHPGPDEPDEEKPSIDLAAETVQEQVQNSEAAST